MAEKHMLERIPGDLEGLDSETKRVKLEEQVTTVAIPQPKVTRSKHFEIFAILEACFIGDFLSHRELLVTIRHLLTT
jgi:hypothetical protein